jgi:hypothetical protein
VFTHHCWPACRRYGLNTSVADPQRFWDAAMLQRAMAAVNYEQLRPMLRKLHSGQPVTGARPLAALDAPPASSVARRRMDRQQAASSRLPLPPAVAALGDSIVATHAGCFHRDQQHLQQHLGDPGSTVAYERHHLCQAHTLRQNPGR